MSRALEPHRTLAAASALLALALLAALPATSSAAEAASSIAQAEATTTTPSAQAPAAAPTTTVPAPAPGVSAEPVTPQVQGQIAQGATPSAPPSKAPKGSSKGGEAPGSSETATTPNAGKHPASPSTLTPALPLALSSSLSGLPTFFIESFRIPPFLLPIFQAAGTAYGLPWQILAAINEIETDYGRDLSVSSAGAEGWMQFLPESWAQYGVDANGDGYRDPYNPADAIFAAARYLRAAGGERNIRAAVYSYNHSQAYVESVILRAQLLGGTPPELLGAITGLTEARFPVHAAAHFSDGFVAAPGGSRQLVGTTIYAQPGAPVIAVQDGQIVQIGRSAALGRFIVLRDAFGNTYTYARLGSVAKLYPVLAPHVNSTIANRISASSEGHEPAPAGPATAGAQPRSPLSEGATVSGLALGSAAGLESAPAPSKAAAAPPLPGSSPAPAVRHFQAGPEEVFLHPLQTGVQVIAGTVLGHLAAAGASEGGAGSSQIVFQIRPAGYGAPLIDPKPILDGWVALGASSIFRAKGENPFLATSPTIGQVLLESKQQLQPQVLRDSSIHLSRCARQDVQTGRVEVRVLTLLEYLSVSGLHPSVAGLKCSGASASAANATAGQSSEALDITAVNGIPIAGHDGPGSIGDETVRKLLELQGLARPQRIVSALSYPHTSVAQVSSTPVRAIRVTFAAGAHASGLGGSGLSASEWVRLVSRLGEIPDPTVARAPSKAALPDTESSPQGGGSGGNH